MTMSTELAAATWRQQIESGTQQHRLLEGHPMHLYYGVDDASRPVFFLVSGVQPHPPAISGLLSMEVRRRSDEKWVAVLTLKDIDYSEAFMGMCLELARRTSGDGSEINGVQRFDATLTQWQKMLGRLSLRSLSKEQIRGLFGELHFGLRLAAVTSLREMVHAWHGPLGAAQDYRHPQLGYFEIKVIGFDARSVRISSIAQLDPDPASKVDLVVLRIDEDHLKADPGSMTLATLIRTVRSSLIDDPITLDAFDDRIARLGVDIEDPLYSENSFHVIAESNFRTDATFPRLQSTHTPIGVERVNYEILLAALKPFALPLEAALSQPVEGAE